MIRVEKAIVAKHTWITMAKESNSLQPDWLGSSSGALAMKESIDINIMLTFRQSST
jgi:hypothetical protein